MKMLLLLNRLFTRSFTYQDRIKCDKPTITMHSIDIEERFTSHFLISSRVNELVREISGFIQMFFGAFL